MFDQLMKSYLGYNFDIWFMMRIKSVFADEGLFGAVLIFSL